MSGDSALSSAPNLAAIKEQNDDDAASQITKADAHASTINTDRALLVRKQFLSFAFFYKKKTYFIEKFKQVETAVRFLKNAKVVATSTQNKRAFLSKKGKSIYKIPCL